jgi:hypothetical protein
MPLGWNSPVKGPVHPKFVNLEAREGLGWLRGFDELIVRCGIDSNGAPGTDLVPNNMGVPEPVKLNLHGPIANLPASRVEVEVLPTDPPTLAVSGVVEEAVLFGAHFTLRTRLETRAGSSRFTIRDEIVNRRSVDAEAELLYHVNFGPPFLEEGARMAMPMVRSAPRDNRAREGMDDFDTFLGPTAGYVEQCYFIEPLARSDGRTLALLHNRSGDKGVILRFNTRELPWFTLWKNTAADTDGYVTGLEPGTDFPNTKTFEREKGRLLRLPPGGRHQTMLHVEVSDSKEGVAAAAREIEEIQKGRPVQRLAAPLPEFSP